MMQNKMCACGAPMCSCCGGCHRCGGQASMAQHGSCSSESCGSSMANDHNCSSTEHMAKKWEMAYKEAVFQTYVETLKSKIQKTWGKKLDRSADAVVAAMECYWKTKMHNMCAGVDLHEKLMKIMTENVK
jgi:hypothetical protein